MTNELASPSASEAARIDLKSYNVAIPMGSLSIGVDNIHHDVFLSPKFVQAARDYLFDLFRQSTSAAFFPGMELRNTRAPDHSGFRKLLSELLQSALTQAKYQKNIEIDLVFRLSVLKFLTYEMGNQFANLIHEGKVWIRQRGEHFERSQQAHVIKARLSELQSARRAVIRRIGLQVAQIVVDVEDNVISKTRRALFGEDFAPYYELCKNRLIFLDGMKDDVYFLENYVLLGNYARDPDRFEAMDALFQEFLREAGFTVSQEPPHTEAIQAHTALLGAVQTIRNDIALLEEQREETCKRLERGESFFRKFLNSGAPADLKASLNDLELRLKHQELKLEELAPQIDSARRSSISLSRITPENSASTSTNRKTASVYSMPVPPMKRKRRFGNVCCYGSSTAWNSIRFCTMSSPAMKSGRLFPSIARRSTCSSCARRWCPKRR